MLFSFVCRDNSFNGLINTQTPTPNSPVIASVTRQSGAREPVPTFRQPGVNHQPPNDNIIKMRKTVKKLF